MRVTVCRAVALMGYLATTDSKTQLPPRYLFGPSKQPYQPFLYSAKQIAQLLMAAGQLPGELRPYTYQTLIGLLACTGLRVAPTNRIPVLNGISLNSPQKAFDITSDTVFDFWWQQGANQRQASATKLGGQK
jgi:hypothetical protein